jgi:hypothetical protein
MNHLRAVTAEQQGERVLFLDGNNAFVVNIDMLSTNGFMARVTGPGDGPKQEWVPIARLQAR